MFAKLLILFLAVPILELALLIRLGGYIGFWPTLAIIVATALTGSLLLKHEGFSVWKRFNNRLSRGELPGTELVDGMIIIISSILLLTPGVLTDLLGLAGLFPPTRSFVRKEVMRRLEQAVQKGAVSVGFGGFDGMTRGFGHVDQDQDQRWEGVPTREPRHARKDHESDDVI